MLIFLGEGFQQPMIFEAWSNDIKHKSIFMIPQNNSVYKWLIQEQGRKLSVMCSTKG